MGTNFWKSVAVFSATLATVAALLAGFALHSSSEAPVIAVVPQTSADGSITGTTQIRASSANFAYPVGPAGGSLTGTYPNPGLNFFGDSGLGIDSGAEAGTEILISFDPNTGLLHANVFGPNSYFHGITFTDGGFVPGSTDNEAFGPIIVGAPVTDAGPSIIAIATLTPETTGNVTVTGGAEFYTDAAGLTDAAQLYVAFQLGDASAVTPVSIANSPFFNTEPAPPGLTGGAASTVSGLSVDGSVYSFYVLLKISGGGVVPTGATGGVWVKEVP